jgi:hypothetical protein
LLVTFYILLSSAAILTAVVGCALIWGFDISRAREIQRTAPQPAPVPVLPAAQRHHEVEARTID